MLNIVCLKAGDKYTADYVNILFDSVHRNLAEGTPGRFICFTDDPNGIDSTIEIRSLPHPGLIGWWNKLALFKPQVFATDDRVLYFDLDTVICGRLDEIAAYDGEFAILRDFYRPHGWHSNDGLQSAVMSWRAGQLDAIWLEYEKARYPHIAGGDQAWIEMQVREPDLWQTLFPDLFVSYKVTSGAPPKKASVVCFHGDPRPHEVLTGWVPEVWKIGGWSRAELDVVCNTERKVIEANMRSAIERNLPWFDFEENVIHAGNPHAVIVGGGPGLASELQNIAWRRSLGQRIWALNGSYKWLCDRKIIPDVQVLVDARPGNAAFVAVNYPQTTYFVASQCAPQVFDALKDRDVTLFHCQTEGMETLLVDIKDKPVHLLGGGTTVGIKAMLIAELLGYRKLHLYGVDSCYTEDKHHAYAQTLNDGERVLEVMCGERKFQCAPWMITQAQDFAAFAERFEGVITVAGDGLIAHMAHQLSASYLPDTETVKIEGELWPSKDQVCRPSVHATLADAEQLIEYCSGRKVAIQAGGNTGLWPKAFAKHFETVYTFEPDGLNFRCLVHNAPEPNIIKFQAALGERHALIELVKDPINCGAHHISAAHGTIPVLRIDDLALTHCDLIQLDIEGYELAALRGAERTIARFRPLISVEEKALGVRYGFPPLSDWLAQLGYRAQAQRNRDVIYTFHSEDVCKPLSISNAMALNTAA